MKMFGCSIGLQEPGTPATPTSSRDTTATFQPLLNNNSCFVEGNRRLGVQLV